ncbi:hypothetical protein C5167_029671 [Papaver somniferum]|nr:hypothetical protein C5167_029671 [Papaver somniferum]
MMVSKSVRITGSGMGLLSILESAMLILILNHLLRSLKLLKIMHCSQKF